MKFAILIALVSVFSFGCGAKQIRKLAEENVTSSICAPACAQQAEFSQDTCVSVCENVVDTSRKVLKNPTLDGIFDVACDQVCAQQAAVPLATCVPVCNFLANSKKSVLQK
jgi:hypothetical protein